MTRPKHIGIVACSAEGASLCYRCLCTEAPALLGPHAHPEVSLHGWSLADYVERLERGDWAGVAALMLASAEKLARAGAELLICPDNTVHQALPLLRDRSPLPWLHIAEAVAEAAKARGYSRLGITGTRWLVEGPVYPAALQAAGLACLKPPEEDCRRIDRIIMEELVYGRFEAASRALLRRAVAGLRERGCDAVVLGCTELPLLLSEADSPLPLLDSTRLLARSALRQALSPRVGGG